MKFDRFTPPLFIGLLTKADHRRLFSIYSCIYLSIHLSECSSKHWIHSRSTSLPNSTSVTLKLSSLLPSRSIVTYFLSTLPKPSAVCGPMMVSSKHSLGPTRYSLTIRRHSKYCVLVSSLLSSIPCILRPFASWLIISSRIVLLPHTVTLNE